MTTLWMWMEALAAIVELIRFGPTRRARRVLAAACVPLLLAGVILLIVAALVSKNGQLSTGPP